jgi:acyl-coenzyme A thioesterase PaaI-like protein
MADLGKGTTPFNELLGTRRVLREPVLPGVVTAEGRVARRSRTIAFAEGEIRDPSGRILATAHGVWTIWPGRPS